MASRLSAFDVFPKYRDDVKVKTMFGACVSVSALVVMLLLFFAELYDFLSVKIEDHLVIDNTNYEILPINFNITFERIPCTLLGLDVIDIGGNQVDIDNQHIIKTELDKLGRPVKASKTKTGGTMKEGNVLQQAKDHEESQQSAAKEKSDDESDTTDDESKAVDSDNPDCGSCYGAELRPKQCCNTCEDVRKAYNEKGWQITDLSSFSQCRREGIDYSDELAAMDRKEGCNVAGWLETKRGQGNFHFAPGHQFSGSHGHLHDFGAFQSGSFNSSHEIHHLSFGKDLEFGNIFNPLDGTQHISAFSGGSIYQYYAKVVPTTYKSMRGGTEEMTNQYSVTMHETQVKMKEGYGLPGVFFFYEFSPLMVQIRETRTPFFHFLTQVCAIVGGVFTVTGIVDQLVYGTLKSITKKKEMGKFG